MNCCEFCQLYSFYSTLMHSKLLVCRITFFVVNGLCGWHLKIIYKDRSYFYWFLTYKAYINNFSFVKFFICHIIDAFGVNNWALRPFWWVCGCVQDKKELLDQTYWQTFMVKWRQLLNERLSVILDIVNDSSFLFEQER